MRRVYVADSQSSEGEPDDLESEQKDDPEASPSQRKRTHLLATIGWPAQHSASDTACASKKSGDRNVRGVAMAGQPWQSPSRGMRRSKGNGDSTSDTDTDDDETEALPHTTTTSTSSPVATPTVARQTQPHADQARKAALRARGGRATTRRTTPLKPANLLIRSEDPSDRSGGGTASASRRKRNLAPAPQPTAFRVKRGRILLDSDESMESDNVDRDIDGSHENSPPAPASQASDACTESAATALSATAAGVGVNALFDSDHDSVSSTVSTPGSLMRADPSASASRSQRGYRQTKLSFLSPQPGASASILSATRASISKSGFLSSSSNSSSSSDDTDDAIAADASSGRSPSPAAQTSSPTLGSSVRVRRMARRRGRLPLPKPEPACVLEVASSSDTGRSAVDVGAPSLPSPSMTTSPSPSPSSSPSPSPSPPPSPPRRRSFSTKVSSKRRRRDVAVEGGSSSRDESDDDDSTGGSQESESGLAGPRLCSVQSSGSPLSSVPNSPTPATNAASSASSAETADVKTQRKLKRLYRDEKLEPFNVEPLKDSFVVVLQYLASSALDEECTAALLQEPYFAIPVKRLRAKLADQMTFCVSSGVWPADLRTKLKHYPKLSTVTGGRGRCFACNKRSHTSTLVVSLRGKQYSRATFRRAAKQSTLSGDNEETIVLGATCAKRVSIYHRLSHYLLKLYRACARKVEGLEHKCSGQTEVIEALLDEHVWINKMFAEFDSLLCESDKLRT